jgi:hypothetical protein
MAKKIILSRKRKVFIILCFILPILFVLLPYTNINIPFAKSMGIEFFTSYRYGTAPIFNFKKNNKECLFFKTEHRRLMSSSNRGGSTVKRYQTTMYLASYNPKTNEIEKEVKITSKSGRIKILGADEHVAYVFADGLNVYDPFTLLPLASTAQLEEKNPQLKGQFPKEIHYYKFNKKNKTIDFTALNATQWSINNNLLASEIRNNIVELKDESRNELEKLNEQVTILLNQRNLLFDSLKIFIRKIQQKQLSPYEYSKQTKHITQKRELLDIEIENLVKKRRDMYDAEREKQNYGKQRIANLDESYLDNADFIKTSEIIANNLYYGISDLEHINKKMKFCTAYLQQKEDVQQNLFIANVNTDQNNNQTFIENTKSIVPTSFINGGFLLNKQNKSYVSDLSNNLFVIISKSAIGNVGKIVFTGIDKKGNTIWTLYTQTKDIESYTIQGDIIFVLCNEEKDESNTHNCDILYQINIKTGKSKKFNLKK